MRVKNGHFPKNIFLHACLYKIFREGGWMKFTYSEYSRILFFKAQINILNEFLNFVLFY